MLYKLSQIEKHLNAFREGFQKLATVEVVDSGVVKESKYLFDAFNYVSNTHNTCRHYLKPEDNRRLGDLFKATASIPANYVRIRATSDFDISVIQSLRDKIGQYEDAVEVTLKNELTIINSELNSLTKNIFGFFKK